MNVREYLLRISAGGLRRLVPLMERIRRFGWAIALRSRVRRMGTSVYLYGPVRVLGSRNVELGGDGNMYDNVLFETVDPGEIRIGSGFRINRGTLISAHELVSIGDDCLIGEYVSIRDSNHNYERCDVAIVQQGFRASPIHIADDVWIGRGSVVLAGTSIGRGAVIGANSVVNRDIPEMEVWAGAPARFLRKRSAEESPC